MMTREELLSMAEIIERMVKRFEEQGAEHERMMGEHRISFGARTEADAKIIARLRSEVEASEGECNVLRPLVVDAAKYKTERDGLLTQVHDMRAEITRLTGNYDLLRREYDKALTLCETDEQTPAECIGSLNARIDRLQDDARSDAKVREELHRINVELRAEVAALQERLRASIARGDFAQMEVAALKSQTPKHPVKAGEWAKRIKLHPDGTPAGSVQQVRAILPAGYEMKSGSIWAVDYCEPCDPPATHDTEAGKAAAERTVRTEPVADEIKVWDVVEVYQATGKHTAQNDVGFIGTVGTIHLADRVAHVRSGLGMPHMVDLCDVRKVRKVTT